MAKKKTIDEFKEDLKKVWGDRYAVSPNSIYVNNKTPINFICPVHGEFRRTSQETPQIFSLWDELRFFRILFVYV